MGRDTLAQKNSTKDDWSADIKRHTFIYAACAFAIALAFVALVRWWQQWQHLNHNDTCRSVESCQSVSCAVVTQLHLVESTASILLIKTTGYVVGWWVSLPGQYILVWLIL